MVRVRHWHHDGSGCKYVCQDDKCKLPHLSVLAINYDQKENPMDIKRCKNCKHWDNDIYLNGVKHPYGACNRFKMPHEINVGGLNFFIDPESVLDEHPAYVEDGSDYHAALRCGPEFGCILWEAKDEA